MKDKVKSKKRDGWRDEKGGGGGSGGVNLFLKVQQTVLEDDGFK